MNGIVAALASGPWDYWLSMDSDNAPHKNPLDLVALDKDIIGCPTPVWHYTGEPGERPIYWNAYRWDAEADAYREWTTRDGLQRVDAVGSGCLLIARRVFAHAAMRRGAFLRTTHDDGTVRMGADLAFCQRARAAGFEVWCHFDYPCHHFREIDLDVAARALKGMLNAH